jgi:hypothetical protein
MNDFCPPGPLLASIGDHISAMKRIERQREKEVAIVAVLAGGKGLRKTQIRRRQKTLGYLGPLVVCRRMNLLFTQTVRWGSELFLFILHFNQCIVKYKIFGY